MATRAKKSAASKSAAKKPAARKSSVSKPAAKKPAAKKPAATKSAARKASTELRLAMSIQQESTSQPPKPKSNFCEDHGRLLRADRTCPVSTCRFHSKPMP